MRTNAALVFISHASTLLTFLTVKQLGGAFQGGEEDGGGVIDGLSDSRRNGGPKDFNFPTHKPCVEKSKCMDASLDALRFRCESIDTLLAQPSHTQVCFR